MVPRLALPLLIAVAALVVPAVPVYAAGPPAPSGHVQKASPAGPLVKAGIARTAARRDLLWATVNICDTDQSPDAMGVRASMPGTGRRQRMYMRFTAYWWSGVQQAWLEVSGARSPWVYAGSARYVSRQSGYTWNFRTPSVGRAYLLRATVDYEWRTLRKAKGARRASWTVARRRALLTKSRIPKVTGGDPPGTSKAMCAIATLPPPA